MATAPSTAALRSASSKTMEGVSPTSSRERRFSCWAPRSMIHLPTSVEPVNPILRIRGSERISSATTEERLLVTTLKTPAGSPAS